MKAFHKYGTMLALAGTMTLASSCTDHFEDLNTNPNASPSADPAYVLSYVQVGVSGHRYEMWRGNLLHAMVWSNQMSSPWLAGTPYQTNDGWASAYWDRSYERLVGGINDVIRQLEATPAENLEDKEAQLAVANIWKVFIFHRLTDFWGDIPYSQAGQGVEGILQPEYDGQDAIYADMLSTLEDAASALNAGENAFGSADLIYGGDQGQWLQFANSLRLRLAMRLSEANPTLAEQHVAAVFNQPLIEVNADNALMSHIDGDQFDVGTNGSNAPIVAGINGNYISSSMMELLNNDDADAADDDPRLPVFAMPNDDGNYVGLPNGSGATIGEGESFSLPNYQTHPIGGTPLFDLDADAMFLSASEVAFLKAEAVVRSWASGDAQALYDQGIALSLEQHGVASNADFEAAVAYTGGSTDAQLEQICTQKWVALMGDGWEAFAEVRRTGYPAFDANAVNGEIPRRLRYPISEQTLNANSYSAAVAAQGADDESTRLYWNQ